MYILTEPEVVDSLAYAVQRGIRVRVILEPEPFGQYSSQQEMFDRLTSFGIEVQWGQPFFTYTHAKYVIVDESVLLVTNQNFTNAGFNRNREYGVVTTEPRYVEEAVAIFESDWTGEVWTIEIDDLVVSPINARQVIEGMINGAESTVWMYSEVLRDEGITGALNAAADRGVEVRLLVNPSADDEDVPYFLDALGHGIEIRVLRDPYVHSKVLIVDGEAALVGSQNYSYTSLELNREIGVVLYDEWNLNQIVSVYESDWMRAEPVDSIGIIFTPIHPPFALTPSQEIGSIPCVRWRVV